MAETPKRLCLLQWETDTEDQDSLWEVSGGRGFRHLIPLIQGCRVSQVITIFIVTFLTFFFLLASTQSANRHLARLI